jgi:hypothetical protein
MTVTGKVLDSEVGPNKDGDTDVRLLTVELADGDDIQTVEYYDCGGRDYLPPDGAEVVIVDISPSYRVAVAVDDRQDSVVAKGEQELYSLDEAGTAKAATIKLTNDAVIEMNGDTDFAVRYSELESAFNQLKQDLNAFILIYNTHSHSAFGGPPSATGLDSAADISGAKIDEIKVP